MHVCVVDLCVSMYTDVGICQCTWMCVGMFLCPSVCAAGVCLSAQNGCVLLGRSDVCYALAEGPKQPSSAELGCVPCCGLWGGCAIPKVTWQVSSETVGSEPGRSSLQAAHWICAVSGAVPFADGETEATGPGILRSSAEISEL